MKYILKGHKAIPVDDVIEWGKWFETADRTIKQEDLRRMRMRKMNMQKVIGKDACIYCHGWGCNTCKNTGLLKVAQKKMKKSKTDQYKCPSYYDDNNILVDCTCGKCEKMKPQKTDKRWWEDEYFGKYGHIFLIYGGFDFLCKNVRDFIATIEDKKEHQTLEEIKRKMEKEYKVFFLRRDNPQYALGQTNGHRLAIEKVIKILEGEKK